MNNKTTRQQDINGYLLILGGLVVLLIARLYTLTKDPITTLASKTTSYLFIMIAIGLVWNIVMLLITLAKKSAEGTDGGQKKKLLIGGHSLTFYIAFIVAALFFVFLIMDRSNQGMELPAENVPLKMQDIGESADAAEQVTYMQQSSILLRYLYVSQKEATEAPETDEEGATGSTASGNTDPADDKKDAATLLTYQVVQPRLDFLKDYCFNEMLKGGTRTVGNETHEYRAADASAWNALEAYQLYYGAPGMIDQYLLRYDDRIIEIYFEETPDEEAISTAVDALLNA